MLTAISLADVFFTTEAFQSGRRPIFGLFVSPANVPLATRVMKDKKSAASTFLAAPVYGGLRGTGNDNDEDVRMSLIPESDQLLIGAGGTVASIVMLYSEYVLSQTGCGLPAGPMGVVGGVEGLSYLSVVGLVAYSLFLKFTTGSGLPAGKYGLLGLAEGLAFVGVAVGIVVLGLQLSNYGYVPNAIPMEGGMCS